jgi:hypothetical protein
MKKISLIISASLILALFGCNKDVVNSEIPQNNTVEKQLRPYKIDKSSSTGWFHWTCKDGSGEGWASTRSEARSQGRAGCGGSLANVNVEDPWDVLTYDPRGMFASMVVENLSGNPILHPVSDINENEMLYWSGEVHTPILNERKAVVYLTIMGVYLGGNSVEDIQSIHNLSPQNFNLLINRNFSENFVLDIDEVTGHYTWIL